VKTWKQFGCLALQLFGVGRIVLGQIGKQLAAGLASEEFHPSAESLLYCIVAAGKPPTKINGATKENCLQRPK
jgi:hypothetical protein